MLKCKGSLLRSAMVAVALAGVAAVPAAALNYSFTGNFNQDDNVQLFNFSVGATSTVVLRTWSYAGGTNAAGATIARGGFDPILALFDGAGAYVSQNDDGGCILVDADAVTGMCWDTYFSAVLDPGDYTVSVMQYDNFAGASLADAFDRVGEGNFTQYLDEGCEAQIFCDVAGDSRDSHWAFDILNVDQATEVPPGNGGVGGVPEPATWAMLIAGFGLVGLAARRRRTALPA